MISINEALKSILSKAHDYGSEEVELHNSLHRILAEDIFADRDGNPATTSLSDSDFNIPKDPFIQTQEYRNYEDYRKLEREVERALANKETIAHETLEALHDKNPEYWKAYYLTGKYYLQKKYNAAAKRLFEQALTKEITTLPDRQRIEKHIEKLSK